MHSVPPALRKSPAIRRRLTFALASAEDRLMRAHAEAAAGFVRGVEGELSFDRALAIYFRLVGVPRRLRRAISVQSLSALSRASAEAESAPAWCPGDESWLRQVARRLRGRRQDALRAQVGQAAAEARNRVKDVYLEGAAGIVATLAGSIPPAEAVQLYIDALEIDPGWAERIFHEAVGALGARAA